MHTNKIKRNSVMNSVKIIFKHLKTAYVINPRYFFGNILALFLNAVAPLAEAFTLGMVLGEVVNISNGGEPTNVLIWLVLFALADYIGTVGWELFATINYTVYRYDFTAYFTNAVFKKIGELDVEFFENPKFADLKTKALDQFSWAPSELNQMNFSFLRSLARALSAAISMIVLAPWAAVLIFISLLPGLYVDFNLQSGAWNIWSEQTSERRKYEQLFNINKDFNYVRELRLLNLAEHFRRIAINILETFFDKERKIQWKRAWGIFSTKIIPIVVSVYFIYQMILTREFGANSVAAISFYISSLEMFRGNLGSAVYQANEIISKSRYVKSIYEFLELPQQIKIRKNAVRNMDNPVEVEFKNVNFKYPGTKKLVLENFSLVIKAGQKIAIVGENGVGKSTIVKLLLRFYDVTSGQILINDIDIKDYDLRTIRSEFAVLLQDFTNFPLPSISENIGFGDIDKYKAELKNLKDATPEQIMESARKAQIEQVILSRDKGYEELLGREFGGADFSGGEHQRLALARTFYKDAGLVVMDEPTSAVDAKAEYEIFESLKEHMANKTVIFISHRFSTVRIADRIIVVEKGDIIEDGSHESLVKENGVYNRMFELQAKGYK